MAQNCPHCGSKYTSEKGIAQNTKRMAREYRCDSCGKYFQVETDAKSASGEWLMTVWGESVSYTKDFISIYKTSDGRIQINQSYKNSQTGQVSYHSGEITPRFCVESNMSGPYATGKYYLSISTKQGAFDSNGVSMYVAMIDMNPELFKKAMSSDAMRSTRSRYEKDRLEYFSNENKMLMDDRRDFLQSIIGIPTNPGTGSAYGPCYIATAVYGSYNCPEVWTLRRFRDNTLASTWYGRAFIRTYYAISPTLVKWFGHTAWFRKLWRGKLDKLVDTLQKHGVESTPYEDKHF